MMLPITVNWERSSSAPAPVFGYNTKQTFNPQPTDNIYDTGSFDTVNPNVFMGKRIKGNLNFRQYSNNKMWAMPYHDDEDNSAWESNVSWAGDTGMTPSANYQGESVTFSQVSNSDLLTALQSTNRQVAKNSDNLVKMGDDMRIMGENDTYFGNSITRLDGVVNDLVGVWQKTVGQVSTNTNAIKTNSDNLIDVGTSIDQINEDHKNMNKGGGDIFPPLPPILPSLSLTTVALGGLAAYFLLRKK